MRAVPSFLVTTKPTRRSKRRCFEIATAGTKIAGKFANRVLVVAQEAEDFAAGRIGDRSEYRLALLWFQNGHIRQWVTIGLHSG